MWFVCVLHCVICLFVFWTVYCINFMYRHKPKWNPPTKSIAQHNGLLNLWHWWMKCKLVCKVCLVCRVLVFIVDHIYMIDFYLCFHFALFLQMKYPCMDERASPGYDEDHTTPHVRHVRIPFLRINATSFGGSVGGLWHPHGQRVDASKHARCIDE